MLIASAGRPRQPSPYPCCRRCQEPQDATAPRPPAPSLARPASPTRAPDAAGFIQRWLVLEPIRVPGQLTESAVQAAVKTEYFPDQFTVIPRDGDTVTVGDASSRGTRSTRSTTTSISSTSPTR